MSDADGFKEWKHKQNEQAETQSKKIKHSSSY